MTEPNQKFDALNSKHSRTGERQLVEFEDMEKRKGSLITGKIDGKDYLELDSFWGSLCFDQWQVREFIVMLQTWIDRRAFSQNAPGDDNVNKLTGEDAE